MELTISIRDLGIILIGAGVFIALCYLICLLRNLVITAKHTNEILKDAEVISAIAAARAKDVDKIVEDVAVSVGDVSNIIKGNQSILQALTCIVNSVGSISRIIKTPNEKK